MKKAFFVFLLLIIIIITFFYSTFYFFLNLQTSNNFVNNSFRKKIISHYLLRRIFRLNQAGDARFNFAANNEFTRLKVIVYYQDGEVLYQETIEKAVDEIKKVINKDEVIIKKLPLTVLIDDFTNDRKLSQLVKKYPSKWSTSEKTAVIQVFILKKYSLHPTYAGLVKDDHNIFIFMDAIWDVSDMQKTTQDAEVSTILHEFGHLLGANHVSNLGCIMNGKVENLIDNLPTTITTSYCPEDLEEINASL
ncbi:MAG: hypothetical protein Q7K55_06710 [Candidatus Levybacteria bacterium]|nr:hypothetical protein [Candidatus Levybacteria bacterium]